MSISPWLMAVGLALLLSLLTLVKREDRRASAPLESTPVHDEAMNHLACPPNSLPDAGVCVPVPNHDSPSLTSP